MIFFRTQEMQCKNYIRVNQLTTRMITNEIHSHAKNFDPTIHFDAFVAANYVGHE